jgi:hypothetical protein
VIKFKGNREVSARWFIDAHHAAALFHFGTRIDEDNGLTGLRLHFEFHESTVGVHDHGVRFFLDVFALPRFGLDENGHLEHDSLTAAAIAGIVRSHVLPHEAYLKYTSRFIVTFQRVSNG